MKVFLAVKNVLKAIDEIRGCSLCLRFYLGLLEFPFFLPGVRGDSLFAADRPWAAGLIAVAGSPICPAA